MEAKKDNKRQEETSGMIRDNTLPLERQKTAPFSYSIVLQKGNKVSTAIYLLTDHIHPSEPIRLRARACAVDFIRDTHGLSRVGGKADRRERIYTLISVLEELLSLFELSFLSRMVSEQNHFILKRELYALREALQSFIAAEDNSVVFPEGLFVVETSKEKELMAPHVPSTASDKGQITSNVSYRRKDRNVLLEKNPKEPKKEIPIRTVKEDRRETILKLIRKDKLVSIKDICSFFTDVGEKTIQRELTKMVGDGLITRTGDKRWSRYSLK